LGVVHFFIQNGTTLLYQNMYLGHCAGCLPFRKHLCGYY